MPKANAPCPKKSEVLAIRMPRVCKETLEALDGPSPSTSAYLILTTVLARHPGQSLHDIIRSLNRDPVTPAAGAVTDLHRIRHLRASLRVVSDTVVDAGTGSETARPETPTDR